MEIAVQYKLLDAPGKKKKKKKGAFKTSLNSSNANSKSELLQIHSQVLIFFSRCPLLDRRVLPTLQLRLSIKVQ